MVNDTRLAFTLPKELRDEIRRVAEEKNLSVASLIKVACTEYIERQKK